MERKSKVKSQEPLPDIPFDLIIDILTRLPAKSLMRFKSVSKQWSSLICSKSFTNRFLMLSSSPPRLYMRSDFKNSPFREVLLSSTPDSDVTTISSFVVDQDLMSIPLGYSISQVYRGLMVLLKEPSAGIYNTTTRQLVVLPDTEEEPDIIPHIHKLKQNKYNIGHDHVHDQYKIVCTVSRHFYESEEKRTLTEHWALSLGRDVTSQWRKIPTRCPPHWPSTQGLTINGRMHYFAFDQGLIPVLVSFDISSEEFSMLPVYELDTKVYRAEHTDLIEYYGKVAVLDYRNLKSQGLMQLWVLEDEEKNRWCCRNTLVLHPFQMDMVNSSHWKLTGKTINGEVIFAPRVATRNPQIGKIIFHVLVYNLQKNHLRKVNIQDLSNRFLNKVWNVIGFDDIENLMHL